jgi:hypothetical protein
MEENKIQGLAITSLVLGILGFFIYGIVLGILAIVFGLFSIDNKMGKAGLIIGIIDIIGVLILFS